MRLLLNINIDNELLSSEEGISYNKKINVYLISIDGRKEKIGFYYINSLYNFIKIERRFLTKKNIYYI